MGELSFQAAVSSTRLSRQAVVQFFQVHANPQRVTAHPPISRHLLSYCRRKVFNNFVRSTRYNIRCEDDSHSASVVVSIPTKLFCVSTCVLVLNCHRPYVTTSSRECVLQMTSQLHGIARGALVPSWLGRRIVIFLLFMFPAPCYAFPHPFNRQPCSNVSTSIHPEVAAARVLPRPCRLSPDMSPVTGPCAFNGRLKPCGTPEQGQRQEAHPQGMQSTDKKLPPAPHARCRRRSSMLTADTHERKATEPLSCW